MYINISSCKGSPGQKEQVGSGDESHRTETEKTFTLEIERYEGTIYLLVGLVIVISVNEYFCVTPFGRLYCSQNFERLVRKSLLCIKCYLALFFHCSLKNSRMKNVLSGLAQQMELIQSKTLPPLIVFDGHRTDKQFISLSQV